MNTVLFEKSLKVFGKMIAHVTNDPKLDTSFEPTDDMGGGVYVYSKRLTTKRVFVPTMRIGAIECDVETASLAAPEKTKATKAKAA